MGEIGWPELPISVRSGLSLFRRGASCAKTPGYEFSESDGDPTAGSRNECPLREDEDRRLHVLPQLLSGIAGPSLQGGLQEVWLLPELFGFLLKLRKLVGLPDRDYTAGPLLSKV
jgi:hypothetical protein